VTPEVAAERLGVHLDTVNFWIKMGRLPKVLRAAPGGAPDVFVPLVALAHAFEQRCAWCGKTFRAKHPEKAKYCCPVHRDRHMYALRRNEQLSGER